MPTEFSFFIPNLYILCPKARTPLLPFVVECRFVVQR